MRIAGLMQQAQEGATSTRLRFRLLQWEREEEEAHPTGGLLREARECVRIAPPCIQLVSSAAHCTVRVRRSYEDIILGGSNVPKGYKLISPEDDAGVIEYFLEEEGRASSSGAEISSFRDKLSETMDKLKEDREHRLHLDEIREKNRQEELKLQERELKLREAKDKREAKKDKLMLKLLSKFVTKSAASSSDDAGNDSD